MKNNLNKYIFFSVTGFVSGILLMIILNNTILLNNNPFEKEIRLEDSKYKFINPSLGSIQGQEEEVLKYFQTERKLKKEVEDFVFSNTKVETSVFFLNLKNSGYFSVNGKETFIPASLIKLPMLISYYKLNEDEDGLFNQKINYNGDNFNSVKNLGNGTIISGNTYTVRELMKEMIINSDNNALQLLYKYKEDSLKSIFQDMKVPIPTNDYEIATKDFLSVRDISRFLLVLYNSSYLNYEDSEEALKILSETTFKDGIVAGIPTDIVVSHKFGERTLKEKNILNNQLHDCGIVYHPQTPYIICIMTKGSDFDLQKLQIQEISRIIYNGIDAFSKKIKINE